MSWILFLVYFFIFLLVISKLKLTKYKVINHQILYIIFITKIFVGILLNIVYSEYYQNRNTSDIFKYFDDSKHIHKSFENNPIHFFQLITGINDENPQLEIYTDSTSHWKYQTSDFSNLTRTTYTTFSNHRTVTKFNAIARIFSLGNINIHVLFMSFLSLLGCILIFKSFYKFISINNLKIYIVIIFLTPSFLVWSSGILKEGLIFLAFGLYFYSLFKLSKNYIKNILILLISILLIFILKYYLLFIVIPLTFLFLIPCKTNILTLTKYVLFFLSFVFIFNFSDDFKNLIIQQISNKRLSKERTSFGGYYYLQFNKNNIHRLVRFDNPLESLKTNKKTKIKSDNTFLEAKKELNYQVFSLDFNKDTLLTTSEYKYYFLDSNKKAGSYYQLPKIEKSFIGFSKSILIAISNVFFKPFKFFEGSLLLRLASFENFLFLIFIVFLFLKRKISVVNLNVLLFNFFFITMLYSIIGLTVPVVGGIVRYKIMGFLLLLISLIMIFDKKTDFVK